MTNAQDRRHAVALVDAERQKGGRYAVTRVERSRTRCGTSNLPAPEVCEPATVADCASPA